MTSIDDLFKRPALPSNGLKRKLEASDAEAAYKAAKLTSNGTSNGHATVEDETEDDDVEAGPTLPPDDEEGRFFGGGVSTNTAEALETASAI